MAEVNIRDLHKSYGEDQVLHGINIDISDGEFVTLVGPSGCGKSTLLKTIAGLEDISSGDVVLGGQVINQQQPKERDIAMVFQSYALYPHMSVSDNMSFSMKMRGMSKQVSNERVGRAAEILGIQNLLKRYPHQLSGGQKQRVAMGRAIVREPKAFLFDEPLSNLDAMLRVQMRTELKQLHAQLGTTTIYVTHDQVEAMTMADKIVVMNGGVVEQQGAPVDVFDRPANRFVAEFIGSPAMNFITGRIKQDTNTFWADDGLEFPLGPQLSTLLDRDLVYGIRPEHIEFTDTGIPVEIQTIEPTGSDTLVLAKAGDNVLLLLSRQRVTFRAGDTAYISPDAAAVHLFDQHAGMRLGGANGAG